MADESMNLSLEDMIKKRQSESKPKKSGKGAAAKPGGRGGARATSKAATGKASAAGGRAARREAAAATGKAARQAQSAKKRGLPAGGGSILSRLGGKVSAAATGSPITVSNLGHDILESELSELFSMCGEVLSAGIVYDRSGRSTGSAVVTMARQSEAKAAVAKFHQRTLDGQALSVVLGGSAPGAGGGGRAAAEDDR